MQSKITLIPHSFCRREFTIRFPQKYKNFVSLFSTGKWQTTFKFSADILTTFLVFYSEYTLPPSRLWTLKIWKSRSSFTMSQSHISIQWRAPPVLLAPVSDTQKSLLNKAVNSCRLSSSSHSTKGVFWKGSSEREAGLQVWVKSEAMNEVDWDSLLRFQCYATCLVERL